MGFGSGFRVWRIVDPGWVGLKGAKAPYGRGIGSEPSLGMYAVGLGLAVVT